MKTKRFTTEQIIAVLKEADGGMPIKELCRKYGMSEATLYNWKAKYGGMAVSEARRLKELEDENRRLKKLVADQALDIQMLKEINSKNWKRPKLNVKRSNTYRNTSGKVNDTYASSSAWPSHRGVIKPKRMRTKR